MENHYAIGGEKGGDSRQVETPHLIIWSFDHLRTHVSTKRAQDYCGVSRQAGIVDKIHTIA